MQPTIFMLALLTFTTLAFGPTGPLGERLAPVALAQASPEHAAAPVTPSPVGIVFTQGDWVYYMAPTDNQPRKLVKGRQPNLSPNGKKVVYGQIRKGRGGCDGLMVLDLATEQTTTLLSPLPTRIDYPVWSPQGDLLAFIYDRKVDIIHADGSGRQKIFSYLNIDPQSPPQWAADGKSLFVKGFDSQLRQIDLVGQELAKTPLSTFTGLKDNCGDWFVLNPQIPQVWAFTMTLPGRAGTNEALFLFDTHTQKRTRLIPVGMNAFFPIWSRDGQHLYFFGSRGYVFQEREYPIRFYRLNRDGTGLTELWKEEELSQ